MAPSGPEKPLVPLEQERERTIELLSQHFAQDNLSLEELERRLERVYKAVTVAALRDIARDLPAEPSLAVAKRDVPAAALRDAYVIESDRIVSVMASNKRRGAWRPARHLDVWCLMSEMELDLTQAQLLDGVTEIRLHALMTSMKIIVPRGVRVVLQPSAIMSDVGDETFDPPAVGSGAPVVRITGPVMMTELKVFVRTRELPE